MWPTITHRNLLLSVKCQNNNTWKFVESIVRAVYNINVNKVQSLQIQNNRKLKMPHCWCIISLDLDNAALTSVFVMCGNETISLMSWNDFIYGRPCKCEDSHSHTLYPLLFLIPWQCFPQEIPQRIYWPAWPVVSSFTGLLCVFTGLATKKLK